MDGKIPPLIGRKAGACCGRVSGELEKTPTAARPPGFWRRWVVEPLKAQLVQGISPRRLGWTIGTGVTLGIFPMFGVRGWLCLAAGALFRLNQPVLHTFKSLSYPLHLLLLLPFVQMGQMLFGLEPLELSVKVFEDSFCKGFGVFLRDFGWIILRASVAWLLVAPLLLVLVKLLVAPVLGRMKFAKAR